METVEKRDMEPEKTTEEIHPLLTLVFTRCDDKPEEFNKTWKHHVEKFRPFANAAEKLLIKKKEREYTGQTVHAAILKDILQADAPAPEPMKKTTTPMRPQPGEFVDLEQYHIGRIDSHQYALMMQEAMRRRQLEEERERGRLAAMRGSKF